MTPSYASFALVIALALFGTPASCLHPGKPVGSADALASDNRVLPTPTLLDESATVPTLRHFTTGSPAIVPAPKKVTVITTNVPLRAATPYTSLKPRRSATRLSVVQPGATWTTPLNLRLPIIGRTTTTPNPATEEPRSGRIYRTANSSATTQSPAEVTVIYKSSDVDNRGRDEPLNVIRRMVWPSLSGNGSAAALRTNASHGDTAWNSSAKNGTFAHDGADSWNANATRKKHGLERTPHAEVRGRRTVWPVSSERRETLLPLATTTPASSAVARHAVLSDSAESDESFDTDDREGRAVWSIPSENAAASTETSGEHYRKNANHYKRHYGGHGKSAGLEYNSSWWSALQTGNPATGALRRSHHKQHHPIIAAHWEDADYGDYAAGSSQVVPLSHGGHHPVYYVGEQKESGWSDLTTKLIVLAIIKLLIAKVMGLGAFKLLVLGLIKLPIALAALALKFAFFVKFFKFIKVLIAVIVVPIVVVAILPLLLPLLLLLLPVLLLPLLLLFPVPVITPANGGGTVVTVTPGRKRRAEVEEQQSLDQLQVRVMNSRRCLQKLACDVGYTSQAVKSYADWVMWLLTLVKPLLGHSKQDQLKSYVAAYKSGLAGRSCYRKYPCYMSGGGGGGGASRSKRTNKKKNASKASSSEQSTTGAAPQGQETTPSPPPRSEQRRKR